MPGAVTCPTGKKGCRALAESSEPVFAAFAVEGHFPMACRDIETPAKRIEVRAAACRLLIDRLDDDPANRPELAVQKVVQNPLSKLLSRMVLMQCVSITCISDHHLLILNGILKTSLNTKTGSSTFGN